MHVESLVNFVAFNRHRPKRYFLFDDPPPPPPRPPPPMEALAKGLTPKGAAREPVTLERAEAQERANAEAQMVLRGALRFSACGAGVARGLYVQLLDLKLEVTPATFELMAESCIEANDLQSASDFLMRMEVMGHNPGNQLLDRVMELYLQQKRAQQDDESKGRTDAASPTEPDKAIGASAAVATSLAAPSGAAVPLPVQAASGFAASSSRMPSSTWAPGLVASAGVYSDGPCMASSSSSMAAGGPSGRLGTNAGSRVGSHVLPADASTFHGLGATDGGIGMADLSLPYTGPQGPAAWIPGAGPPMRAHHNAPNGHFGAHGPHGGGLVGQGLRRRRANDSAVDLDLPAFSVPDEFAAARPAEPDAPQESVGSAVGSNARRALEEASGWTLEMLKGRWYRNGDRAHCWTVGQNGRTSFNGKYPGEQYDFQYDFDGTRAIYVPAHRLNGEELDLSQSTTDCLVWVGPDGLYSACWKRTPEDPTASTSLSASAAVFVPGSGFGADDGGHSGFAFSVEAPTFQPAGGGEEVYDGAGAELGVTTNLRPTAEVFLPGGASSAGGDELQALGKWGLDPGNEQRKPRGETSSEPPQVSRSTDS